MAKCQKCGLVGTSMKKSEADVRSGRKWNYTCKSCVKEEEALRKWHAENVSSD